MGMVWRDTSEAGKYRCRGRPTLGNTSRARNEMEEEHDQIVRVDGNIFGWS